MQKRITCVVLVLLVLVMIFSGCSGDQADTASPDAAADTEDTTADTPEDSDTDETGDADEQDTEPEIEPMTFKWSIATAADHTASIVTQEICDEIYKKTDGAITIELYVANALGSEAEALDMVRSGAILGGTIGQQMFEPFLEDISGWMLPYTFSSAEAMDAFFWGYAKDNVWNGPINEATGMTILGASNYGLRHLTTKGIEVKSPADLNGVKIRSMEQPVSISYVTALGGNAVPIAWSELYMALQTGTAVGQENPVSNIIAGKFYEVQDYMVMTGHAGGLAVACVNDDVFATIPAEYQTIIEEAFAAGSKKITEDLLAKEEDSIAELEGLGMTVLRVEDIDIEAFEANAAKVVEEQFGGSEYDSWREYQKIAMDWCAENGY